MIRLQVGVYIGAEDVLKQGASISRERNEDTKAKSMAKILDSV